MAIVPNEQYESQPHQLIFGFRVQNFDGVQRVVQSMIARHAIDSFKFHWYNASTVAY